MIRIAIVGDGKMGRSIAELARTSGCEVVAVLGRESTADGLTRSLLNGAEVVIEFTRPEECARLVRGALTLGVPVVSGTTGWDEERAKVEAEVRAGGVGAFLWAPNFALGVHLFAHVVADAARRFGRGRGGRNFGMHIIETHHQEKLDAPSGTGKWLADVVARESGSMPPVTSVRTGYVPGTHEIIFDGPFEQVRLVHEARDRRIFAAGAIEGAKWIVGRRGVFSIDDLLGDFRS